MYATTNQVCSLSQESRDFSHERFNCTFTIWSLQWSLNLDGVAMWTELHQVAHTMMPCCHCYQSLHQPLPLSHLPVFVIEFVVLLLILCSYLLQQFFLTVHLDLLKRQLLYLQNELIYFRIIMEYPLRHMEHLIAHMHPVDEPFLHE